MTKPKLQSLKSRLTGAMIENFEGKKFLADSTLACIARDTDLDGCLREAKVGPLTVRKEVHDAILDVGMKTFAILAMMQSQPIELLLNFLTVDQMNSGNLDSRLPYTHIDHLIEILGSGSLLLATEFFHHQWTSRQVTISENSLFLEIVYINQRKQVMFACKEMAVDPTADSFANEKHILVLLRQIRHSNMIQLLASYSTIAEERGHIRCLIFPLADMSLETVLENDVNVLVPVYFQSNEHYLDQLYGLASALESLHNYVDAAEGIMMKGSHFDLAPRNILIDKGKFLLADFGLSRLRNQSSDSKTPFKGGFGDYLAPECTVEGFALDYEQGRKSDVWSLGGILSVLVVFNKRGKKGVDAYRKARRHPGSNHGITYRFHADGDSNNGMHVWLTELTNDLTEIERALLNTSLWMLSLEPQQRPSMIEISTCLYLLAQRALFRFIDNQFESLRELRPAMQLKIEQNRFLIWNTMAGLAVVRVDPDSELREEIGVSWLVEARAQFQAVSHILQDIREETEFLLSGLSQASPVAPVYDRLRDLNGTLWNLAPLRERTIMMTTLESTLDRIYDEHGLPAWDLSSATNVPPWERDALLLATMRFMNKKTQTGMPSGEPSLKVPASHVKIGPSVGQANLVSLEDRNQPSRHLCEWITYQLHTVDQVPDRLFARVESIAQKFSVDDKPADFKVLHCRGYFHDLPGCRFGVIYDLPNNEQPVTLRQVMKGMARPSLQCLFSLAHVLVKSVHHFHRAEWMHKNVSSSNIVFFDSALGESANSDKVVDALPTPYLVGFNHSRPMDLGTFTTGGADIDKMYMHPKYRVLPQPRFRFGYEYFSVGLLLLEIGLWEPITRSRLLGDRKIEDYQSQELLALWYERGVPLLGPLMGQIYRDAVAWCLSPERVGMEDPFARQEFGDRVVTELGRWCV
ncbi:hypothetical protein G7Z17_g3473 [Cylindrodendrum hubeiense]|uniref:Protein kinase domain-containing protein n=1 Tax=Cylindrodendrum hubeiense TaxID=595255 RepID=A0A9P5LJB4_9HYPO|nr:hypothetical protein G7Z17_g3473 [Cylindrodendrum hubeiense]